jgi:hypothetical protein
MVVSCLKTLRGISGIMMLALFLMPEVMVLGAQDTAQTDEAGDKALEQDQGFVEAKKSPLPSVDSLIEAKLSALKSKQEEQEILLSRAEARLAQEQLIEKTTFDHNAYLSLSMINSAPPLDYRLNGTEIYIDGKLIARGGKRNQGLPRATEVFFGAVAPGCHQVLVKAKYTRQKNDLISRFKVNRVEHIVANQAFIAKNGYRVELEIEGFERHNTFANWFRGPAVRFNKSARPNFLPGAAIVSMDDVLKQGQVKIDYITEDQSKHRLLKKSLSIDGLPILVDEQHDQAKDGNVVFNAPLRQGKHTLNVTLLFAEKKWIMGGPSYNFRLSFDRDFYVISGQTTVVNLVGMPKSGIKSNPEHSRYARATSQILSREYPEFFPELSCQEMVQQEALEKARNVKKNEPKPQEPAQAQEPKPEVQPQQAEPQGHEKTEGG